MPLLSVDEVSVYYGRIAALRGLSVVVAEGSAIAVVGANGAGKSTLLRAISGLVEPSSGRIRFADHEIAGTPPHALARAGITHVPEGRGIFPSLTVRENLELVRARVGTDEASLADVFGLFPRLRERQTQRSGTLSGGEQQMLSLAMGLLARPRLLLVDEPSLGLAPILVQELFDVFRQLREQQVTLVIVEQYINVVLDVVDHVYLLEKGRLVRSGPPGEFASEDMASTYFGSAAMRRGHARRPGANALDPSNHLKVAFTAGELRRLKASARATGRDASSFVREASLDLRSNGPSSDPDERARSSAGQVTRQGQRSSEGGVVKP